jgi:hypothetical protein
MYVVDELSVTIEYLRSKMHELALARGISHPLVVEVSEKLDRLLNKFYREKMAHK